MKQGRFYVATALALSLYSLSGCSEEAGSSGGGEGTSKPIVGDWGDENKYPELGGAYHTLTAASTTPVFASGTLTVASAATEVLVISKRAVDSAILVNGRATGATSTTMKKLMIATTANDQTIVLDFLGGVFGVGTATARGIDVNLGAGTDSFRVRGSTGSDSFTIGTDGVALNTDNFRDIDVAWATIESTSFALAGGNDSIIATAGAKGVAGNAAIALSLYGGDGNDVLTGGDASDALFGGAGNDTITGGGTGAMSEVDIIAGEIGADTITQGADNNGPDLVHCGTEAVPDPLAPVNDTVTYALRGTAAVRPTAPATLAAITAADGESVNVTVGGAAACALTGDTGCSSCTVSAGTTCATVDGNGLAQYPTTLANDGNQAETGGALNGAVWEGSTKAVTENDAIYTDCEIVIGSQDNDTLSGDDGANTLYGGTGDDVLTGGAGNDVLYGDVGDDTLTESSSGDGAGADVLNGGAGTDVVTYELRSNSLTVTMDGADDDDGESSEGDNVKVDVENLIAGSGADTITGNLSNNVITGGLGVDVLSGLAGDDTFDETGATGPNGADVFNGGLGMDLVDYSGRTASLTVTMDGADANDGEVGENDDVNADIENLNGGTDADTITGNALNNIINGGAGVDTISGLAGDDTLDGEGDATGTNDGGEGGADACFNQTTRTACEL